MATHTGSEGTIKIGSNEISEIQSYSYEETMDPIEDTSMGDTARTYKTGLTGWSGSIEVLWDETDTSGQGAMTIGSSVAVNFYPEGATTGDIYHNGTALVTGVSRNAEKADMVQMSLNLQGTGALTEATVS